MLRSRTSAPCSRDGLDEADVLQVARDADPEVDPVGAGRRRSVHVIPSATTVVHRTFDGFSARILGSAPSFDSSLVPAGMSRWVES